MVTAREIPARDQIDTEIGETERLIEEFKQRISQTLERERAKLREIAGKEAKAILAKAYQESANITSKANEESQHILEAARERADREREVILAQARERAEQIVLEAEETTRREAKERTRKEVEIILSAAKDEATKIVTESLEKARLEAEKIVSNARFEAENQSRKIIETAELEARQVTRSALELKQRAESELIEAQKKAGAEAAFIINAAREKARQVAEAEANSILSQATQEGLQEKERLVNEARKAAEDERIQIVQKAKLEAESIINAAKTQIRIQLEESSRLMMEIQKQIQKAMGLAGIANVNSDQNIANVSSEGNNLPQVLDSAVQNQEVLKSVNPNVFPVNTQSATTVNKPMIDSSPVVSTGNMAIGTETRTKPVSSYSDGSRTYQGRLKIDIAPPVDNEQINSLAAALASAPGLAVVNKGIIEDGSAWIEVEAASPLPLLEILHQIPFIKDVVGARSYIIIALKAKQQQ